MAASTRDNPRGANEAGRISLDRLILVYNVVPSSEILLDTSWTGYLTGRSRPGDVTIFAVLERCACIWHGERSVGSALH